MKIANSSARLHEAVHILEECYLFGRLMTRLDPFSKPELYRVALQEEFCPRRRIENSSFSQREFLAYLLGTIYLIEQSVQNNCDVDIPITEKDNIKAIKTLKISSNDEENLSINIESNQTVLLALMLVRILERDGKGMGGSFSESLTTLKTIGLPSNMPIFQECMAYMDRLQENNVTLLEVAKEWNIYTDADLAKMSEK